jgi:hypothetical protein
MGDERFKRQVRRQHAIVLSLLDTDLRVAVVSWLPYSPSCPGGQAGKPWVHERSATTVFDVFSAPPAAPCHQQVWYDGPLSLPIRYKWLDDGGFRGFGMWCVHLFSITLCVVLAEDVRSPHRTADMVASIKGYVGPLSFNKTTSKAGPTGCNGVVCDPGSPPSSNQSCARAGACVEDWNQTLANGQAMWGAIPPRKSDDSDSAFRAPAGVQKFAAFNTRTVIDLARSSGVVPVLGRVHQSANNPLFGEDKDWDTSTVSGACP